MTSVFIIKYRRNSCNTRKASVEPAGQKDRFPETVCGTVDVRVCVRTQLLRTVYIHATVVVRQVDLSLPHDGRLEFVVKIGQGELL